MSLTTDLLIFLAAFIIINFKGATAENFALDVDEEEESLKQAIFLVELLKSDFGKSLRENNYVISNADNITEENSTCPTPIGDLENATEPVSTADNSTSISPGAARSDVPAATPSTPPEVRVLTSSPGYIPPGYGLPVYGAPGYGAPGYGLSGYGVPAASTAGSLAAASIPPVPGNPPYSNWPAMPNMPMPGYQISPGMPQRRNFPADENYRFPYRFSRRRMMPDYYYFDAPPVIPQGNYRRQGSDDQSSNKTENTQPSATNTTLPSNVTSLRAEENITPTSNTPATALPLISQNTPRPLTPTSMSSMQTRSSRDESALTSLLSQPTSGKASSSNTILSKVDITPTLIAKVTSAITSKRKIKQKLKNAPKSNLRHSQTLATNEKYTSEDVEMSQAASELLKEFKGTTTENMLMSNDFEKPTRRKSSTTMKIYLKGSSRLPVPLPENNAFCYAYPHNALCGSVM